jgi:hypothetical protein
VGGAVEDLGGIPLLLRPVAAEHLLALAQRFLPGESDHDGCV